MMESKPLTVVPGRDVQADDLLLVHTWPMQVPAFKQVVSVFGTGHGRVQLEVRDSFPTGGIPPPSDTVWLDADQQVVVIR